MAVLGAEGRVLVTGRGTGVGASLGRGAQVGVEGGWAAKGSMAGEIGSALAG